MPGPGNRGVQPASDLQWLDLSDFTAGIYDYSAVSNVGANVPPPNGAADVVGTFSCIGLPQGGIGPLPGVTGTYIWPANNSTTTPSFITGALIHDELGTGDTEGVFICCYDDGTTHSFQGISYILETATATQIVLVTGSTAVGFFGSPYPEMTRAQTGTSTVGTNIIPAIVWPAGPPELPAGTTQVYMYPDPAGQPTPSYTPRGLITGAPGSQTSVAGQLVVHESRIFIFAATNYGWPGGTTFFTNENINFTDPPTSVTLGNQQNVLFTEAPYGYGAAGSISAGELFLVKKRGGGIVLQGDINTNPSSTQLPGVTSTGNFFGRGASTPIGFVYGALDKGMWSWNGSNTSQKISNQLDDSFYLPAEFNTTFLGNNYGFYVAQFGDWIYTSNNYLYDTKTNAWWRYFPSSGQASLFGVTGNNLFWVQPVNGNFVYGVVFSFTNSAKTFMYRFDPTSPTQNWQWQSLPIRLTQNRQVIVREVVVRASSNSLNTGSQIKVTVLHRGTIVGSVTTPSAANTIGPSPVMIRMPIGAVSAGSTPFSGEDITIRVNGIGNGGAAPTLHSVTLGWEQIEKMPTTGVSS